MSRDYVQIATDYAHDVVSGKIPACLYVRQACQRQIDDLARTDWGYTFDPAKARKICKFMELLPHVEGKQWAGQDIVLKPWQMFILTTVFGWVDASANRRYRKVYEEVPRKNAKTTKLAGVGLFCLAADGEVGAGVYSAASKASQAKISLDVARRMVKKKPKLKDGLGLTVYEHSIFRVSDGSHFRALSKDNDGSQDGLNISCALVDEVHAHTSRDTLGSVDTATGARAQPLVWEITTAGSDRSGICYEERAYALKVLSGGVQDETVFAIVYTIDEGDPWFEEATWRKANPNYGVSVNPEDLRRKATKAQEMASAQNEFLTKHLNVWVNASTAWMNMSAWDKCADPTLEIEDFIGERCFEALDVASKLDLTAKARVFPRDGKYYLFCESYLPESVIDAGVNDSYAGWVNDGWIIATDGNTVDLPRIGDGIREDASRFAVETVHFDPWNATELATRLLADGAPMVECRMSTQNLSEAMKLLEAAVADGTLVHDGNPVLSWCVSNIVCKTDANDNIFPRKEFPENKIDCAVAAIMAFAALIKAEQSGPAYLETGGVLYVD